MLIYSEKDDKFDVLINENVIISNILSNIHDTELEFNNTRIITFNIKWIRTGLSKSKINCVRFGQI